ncbi:hypothetical protein HDG70_000969 [Carboxydothermus ferrireducens DSM 11255]|uniref:Uncharacterized protein n=2 Tax=Carboxydothermus TaxID=129957 RepID=Q3AF65_CARHZ|nr:hypothetical protein CHY_0356 [Carboxydothermus hydrogenoformans Z-2901]NYE57254.1 hypothetical protein [Carboxydothermus ferrireducens DSM 11255]
MATGKFKNNTFLILLEMLFYFGVLIWFLSYYLPLGLH